MISGMTFFTYSHNLFQSFLYWNTLIHLRFSGRDRFSIPDMLGSLISLSINSYSSNAFWSVAMNMFMSSSLLNLRLLILFWISNFLCYELLVNDFLSVCQIWNAVLPCPSIIFLVLSPRLFSIIYLTRTSFRYLLS
jgi:hypothetical protein